MSQAKYFAKQLNTQVQTPLKPTSFTNYFAEDFHYIFFHCFYRGSKTPLLLN